VKNGNQSMGAIMTPRDTSTMKSEILFVAETLKTAPP
jgi:hypothetical protein